MPTYSMKAPNGRTYDIEGPAGATEDQVRAEILRRDPSAGKPSPFTSGEKPSYLSEQRAPSVPKSGALNPHQDRLAEILKEGGRRRETPTVGNTVGPLAVMAAPVLAGSAIGTAGRGTQAAQQGAQALEAWVRANPVKAIAVYELLKKTGLGGLTKYLPHGGEK